MWWVQKESLELFWELGKNELSKIQQALDICLWVYGVLNAAVPLLQAVPAMLLKLGRKLNPLYPRRFKGK